MTITSLENHFGQYVWVHRKGATSLVKIQLVSSLEVKGPNHISFAGKRTQTLSTLVHMEQEEKWEEKKLHEP